MIKAETLENLILSMGKQKKTRCTGDTIMSYCYKINLSEEQRNTWLEQFKLLEKSGYIHPVGDNEQTLDYCASWSGNNNTAYIRFVVTLLKDAVIMEWITKFSIE